MFSHGYCNRARAQLCCLTQRMHINPEQVDITEYIFKCFVVLSITFTQLILICLIAYLLFLQVMWCNILYTNALFGYISRLCRVNECIGYLSLFLL